jgi:hypothetical protein
MIVGQVDKVALEGSAPMLYVGGIPVALSQVRDIRSADAVTVGTGQAVVEDDALEPTN